MILSNVEILKAIRRKQIRIGTLTGNENLKEKDTTNPITATFDMRSTASRDLKAVESYREFGLSLAWLF